MVCDALVQNLESLQRAISQAAKQVIVYLRPTTEDYHLLVRLKDEETLKKILEKKSTKKVVEEVSVNESEPF